MKNSLKDIPLNILSVFAGIISYVLIFFVSYLILFDIIGKYFIGRLLVILWSNSFTPYSWIATIAVYSLSAGISLEICKKIVSHSNKTFGVYAFLCIGILFTIVSTILDCISGGFAFKKLVKCIIFIVIWIISL